MKDTDSEESPLMREQNALLFTLFKLERAVQRGLVSVNVTKLLTNKGRSVAQELVALGYMPKDEDIKNMLMTNSSIRIDAAQIEAFFMLVKNL